MSTPSAEALNANSSVSRGEPVVEAPSDSNSNPPASPELAEATPLASTESVDPSLPNPLAFTWLDKNNHSASITFKAIGDALQWVPYISVACGAHKVPGKWNTYQCPTILDWGLGLWKAKGLQAIIKFNTPLGDPTPSSPANAFEVGIMALFAEGETEPAQIVFFASAATIGDFIEKLKEKGIFVSATSTEIYLTERGKVALADELALELGGAYMPYDPEPPFHIEYIVDFGWPQGNKKNMIFFPTLFKQNAFVCIMTKIGHGHRGRPSGTGIPVNVDSEQDWEYGLQLALYLGGVGEKIGSAENSATLEVSPLPASTGWMLRDAPSSFREIVFRSPLAAAGFERDAVRFLGAKWMWDDTIGGHGIYLEAPTRISYRLGLVDAKARGGRVKRQVEASKDSELLVLPPCAKFCVMPFSNRQFVFFPSEGIKNAWTARMKVELGATMILGWLRVSDREKQAKGDTIAKEMGGWVVNVPRLKGVSEDGVDSPTATEDASSQSGDIFTSYIRQAETSRSAALFFHSEEKQQAHAKALLALPGAQQTGEWVDVATVENWTHGVKTAQDFDGALMPINAETSADEEASDSGIVIFPGSLRYAGSTEKLEARWLFPFPADLDKWSNAVLAFPGAKKDGEWIDVQTVEDYDKGFKLAFENGGKPRPDNKPQVAHKQSGINFGPGPVIFPGGLRLNTVTGDPVRQARWLFPLPADLEEWFKAVLELPGAKKGGDEWVDVNTEPEFAKGEELAKKHGGSPWDGKPILEPLVPANTLSLPLPISILPPVYTSPVFCRNAGSNTDWTMVFSSKSIRDKFILTMLDDHDADWIKGWLEPKQWSTVIELTRDLEGVAVQLPRRFPKDMSKHKFVTDYFQAGSVKGQLLFFRTALQQALFEEILVNCWPKEFKKVNGWVEAADSNSWFDGLAAAKVLGVVVLNMPEDRYIIA